MNTDKIWSDSLTKNYLTKYAEGLAVVQYDKHCCYYSRRSNQYAWLVINKDVDKNSTVHNEDNNETIKFHRVRTVTIHQDYMTCSCGYVQRYLLRTFLWLLRNIGFFFQVPTSEKSFRLGIELLSIIA